MSDADRKGKRGDAALDRNWHLATDEQETALTDLEFAIMRISEAFGRWQADCLACCAPGSFSAADNALLHMIRMHGRPKGLSELARLMNRDDVANLQYSLRKLVKAGLAEKSANGGSKKGVTYRVTPLGREVTDRFAQIRRELLVDLTHSISGWSQRANEVVQLLNIMVGMYDQAACVAATHRLSRQTERQTAK